MFQEKIEAFHRACAPTRPDDIRAENDLVTSLDLIADRYDLERTEIPLNAVARYFTAAIEDSDCKPVLSRAIVRSISIRVPYLSRLTSMLMGVKSSIIDPREPIDIHMLRCAEDAFQALFGLPNAVAAPELPVPSHGEFADSADPEIPLPYPVLSSGGLQYAIAQFQYAAILSCAGVYRNGTLDIAKVPADFAFATLYHEKLALIMQRHGSSIAKTKPVTMRRLASEALSAAAHEIDAIRQDISDDGYEFVSGESATLRPSGEMPA